MSDNNPLISLEQIKAACAFHVGHDINYSYADENENVFTFQHQALSQLEITKIKSWIDQTYLSPTGYGLLKKLYDAGNLRFFANNGNSSLWDPSQQGVSINFESIQSSRQFNRNGTYTIASPLLTFVHELSHGADGSDDPPGSYGDSALNNINYWETTINRTDQRSLDRAVPPHPATLGPCGTKLRYLSPTGRGGKRFGVWGSRSLSSCLRGFA